MKNRSCLIFSAFLATSLFAQQATNVPPSAPAAAGTTTTNVAPQAAATNVPPPAKAEKKKSSKQPTKAKKKAPGSELRTVPLVAGPAVVIASNVNVRGQAKLKSEIVTRLTKGQPVTVLEEVTLKNSAPDEPSAWAKILLPANSRVWVNTMFINATNKTVVPRKLNVRSGPGENYSVLGVMNRDDKVKEISTKGDWIEIEAPADAYAFVAAQYLTQEPVAIAAATPPEPTAVTDTPVVAPPPTDTPVTDTPVAEPPVATTPEATNVVATPPAIPEPEPPVDQPPPKRVVQREGIVRGTISIQAPTHFELASPDNGRTINYLYTTSVDLDLKRYKGLHIIVTGEEGLDERWRNTPVITIHKIQVLD